MGSVTASDFAESVSAGEISLDVALQYHFTGNCYPPLPLFFIEPAKAAIKAYGEGKYDKHISLPDGVTFNGSKTAPASELVDFLRITAFVPQGD